MKSTLKRAIVTLAVIGLLVVVPSMCGTWTQLSKQGRRVWHDVGVGMGLIAEPQPVSLSVIIKPDGSCTTNGKEWAPPVAVKTQVYDSAQTVSGVLAVRNQDQPGVYSEAPTKEVHVGAAGISLVLMDITGADWSTLGPDATPLDPYPSPPMNNRMVFMYSLFGSEEGDPIQRQYIYFNDDTPTPWDIELAFSVTVGAQRLNRTETTTKGTGREGTPVYAKEVTETDAWEEVGNPWDFSVTFGNLSAEGTQWYAEESWQPAFTLLDVIAFYTNQFTGTTGRTYAELELSWSATEVNFDGRGYTSGPLRFTGSGNKISLDLVSGFVGTAVHQIYVGQPYLPDFSEFAVVDRGGELIDTLRIEGGFKVDKRHAWTLPYGDPGTTIYPTVAEIRAIGQYSTPPGVTGLDYEDTDYEHQLWTPPLSFAINAASARAHKLI